MRIIDVSVQSQKTRNLTFHGLRHTYVTLGLLAGISELEMRVLAGHKSIAMTDRYSHANQVIDFKLAGKKFEDSLHISDAI